VSCGYNLVKKKEWLIDWNNTFLYKEKVDGKIITFWSSDQPPFLVSNIILTTNMLTLMVRHIRFFLIFSDESGHWPLRQRCVHIHIYICFWTVPHRVNLYLHYHHLKKYPMFIKVCFLAQTKKERERQNLNCPSHHISFVWYWTTFRNAMYEHWTRNWPLAKN
jgi:hypothetical protein